MPVKLLMAAHGLVLQLIDQVAAIASVLSYSQLLAYASIACRKAICLFGRSFAFFERVELLIKGSPVIVMPLLKHALFHVGPIKPRAIP
jgi:hypothetical protein